MESRGGHNKIEGMSDWPPWGRHSLVDRVAVDLYPEDLLTYYTTLWKTADSNSSPTRSKNHVAARKRLWENHFWLRLPPLKLAASNIFNIGETQAV